MLIRAAIEGDGAMPPLMVILPRTLTVPLLETFKAPTGTLAPSLARQLQIVADG